MLVDIQSNQILDCTFSPEDRFHKRYRSPTLDLLDMECKSMPHFSSSFQSGTAGSNSFLGMAGTLSPRIAYMFQHSHRSLDHKVCMNNRQEPLILEDSTKDLTAPGEMMKTTL
eukprot:gb/GEZJ01007048.1/.p2 GENE.gb/GEZJ01007048.1/~~gb/GEZJ01007048.1/.p2  ORF type:complete len:113 (-),score=6.99 gb/GEZJ01007048.1/:24-362(-)